MTEKERLISLMKEVNYPVSPGSRLAANFGTQHRDHIFEVVADHLLANGVTLGGPERFLCKPGDTVYFILCNTNGHHEIKEGFALSVEYSICYKPLVTIRYNDSTLDSTKHYLGLKAFMSYEEAEVKLAEMREKGEVL